MLAAATGGARFDALLEVVRRAEPSLDAAEAEEFLWDVIANQLLVSSVGFGATGSEATTQVIAGLAAAGPEAQGAVAILERVQTEVAGLTRSTRPLDPGRYQAVARALLRGDRPPAGEPVRERGPAAGVARARDPVPDARGCR